MFAVKGRGKVTLLFIGVLVGVLCFQPKAAEATHSSISCLIKKHDIVRGSATVLGSSYTGRNRTSPTKIKCGDCYGTPVAAAKHKQKEKSIRYSYWADYEHRTYGTSSWSFCHTHTGIKARKQWITVKCGKKARLNIIEKVSAA